MKIALIIPTLNAGSNFSVLLNQLNSQSCVFSKFLIDSDSSDCSDVLALSSGFKIFKIARNSFNHGATRQFAVNQVLHYFHPDIIIFISQDILLFDDNSIAELVKIFYADNSVGICYGRQLPYLNASVEAAFLRNFNYPPVSRLKSLKDIDSLGLNTAFNSNSFAAYRTNFLLNIGGFPDNVILAEDMFVAAKMILAGYKIFYNANAKVYHSHNYTAIQEFQRYFDIGVFHARESWIRKSFGSAERKGLPFVLNKFRAVIKVNPIMIFAALFRDITKFIGYRLGLCEKFLPRAFCKILSMNKNFWS